MEIAGYGGHKGYARLALGAAPMLVAWPTLGIQPMTALLVQWIGFTGLWVADSKATTAGWSMPLLPLFFFLCLTETIISLQPQSGTLSIDFICPFSLVPGISFFPFFF